MVSCHRCCVLQKLHGIQFEPISSQGQKFTQYYKYYRDDSLSFLQLPGTGSSRDRDENTVPTGGLFWAGI